jgi:xylulokinase
MHKKLYLTVDVGTSAVKIAVFDRSLKLLHSVVEEYTLQVPAVDYVEIDPNEYYQSLKHGLSGLCELGVIDRADIRSICISSQGETFIALDANNDPLSNAVVWLDNRAKDEARVIENEFGREETYHITGQQEIVATWTACKLLWMKHNRSKLYSKIRKILLVQDYLLFKLTGEFYTDYSMLPSSLLFDIVNKCWWRDMLTFLDIEEGQLPSIVKTGSIIGEISQNAAKDLKLQPRTTIVSGALDQMAGLIGSGNIEPGMITETTGTAMAVSTTVNMPVFNSELTIPCYIHAISEKYALLPWTQTAGMVLRWFRDNFTPDISRHGTKQEKCSYDRLSMEAEKVPPGSEGLIMLPFLAGAGSPEFNSNAKGVFFGITLTHGRGHFIRAIMEAVAFTLKRNILLLEKLGVNADDVRSLGGASKSNLWCQIKADVLKKKVLKPLVEDVSSLGLAIVSSIALENYRTVTEAVSKAVKIGKVYYPDDTKAGVYDEQYERYLGIYDKLKDQF